MNWKLAAKFWYSQFKLWRDCYNEIADKYMISESHSGGAPDGVSTTTKFRYFA